MRYFDSKQFAASKPVLPDDARCFFSVTTNLGWKVMGERLRGAIEVAHLPARHGFRAFTLPEWIGKVTWSANYSQGEQVAFPLFDPHFSFKLASASVRRESAPFDFVVAATSPLASAFLTGGCGKPVLQFVDGTRDLFRREFGIDNISDAAIRREKQHFQAVQHTFALSSWAKKNIVDVYGVPPERVTVVPPLSQRVVAGGRIRRRTDRLQVAFVGGDFERKGGNNLMAWQSKHLHRFVDLHVVTDDRWRDESIPATRWYGSLSNQRVVNTFLPAVDVLCHPTTRDCSAIVVAEAAALGIPSVASNVGGISDLIEHGSTGFLANHSAGDAFISYLERLHVDRALLDRMSQAVQGKAVLEFAPEKVLGLILSSARRALAR
jgi:Glycosyl transferases group 1/Glycosyltransferase Family 4